jgi:hypothetical protein
MGFKLGSERRELRMPGKKSFKGSAASIYQKQLDSGIKAEANNDGSMFIDPSVELGSDEFKKIVKHEAQHMMDMESGRAAYGDEWVMWDGKIYIRKTIDGQPVIDGPAGRLPEGHPDHPWEQSAIEAETNPNIKMEVESVSTEIVDPSEIESLKEVGDSPNKFLKKLRDKVKNSKFGQSGIGKFALGGGIVGAAIRGIKGDGSEEGGEGGHSHGEDGEVIENTEGGESTPEGAAAEQMEEAKKLSQGMVDKNAFWAKLKKKHAGNDLDETV